MIKYQLLATLLKATIFIFPKHFLIYSISGAAERNIIIVRTSTDPEGATLSPKAAMTSSVKWSTKCDLEGRLNVRGSVGSVFISGWPASGVFRFRYQGWVYEQVRTLPPDDPQDQAGKVSTLSIRLGRLLLN